MAKYFLIASLALSAVSCQDRYWGSYSANYPAGGSGSSADVAYDVANLQEASRTFLTGAAAPRASAPRVSAPRASVPRAVAAPTQPQSFATTNQASRPGGYVHNPTGDTGNAYVHDTTGDHGPYYYWKLRQQGKSGQAAPAAPAPAPAPQRQVVTVRKQRPIKPAFANFQATPTAQAAPAQQRYYQPAPVRQAPAPVRQAPAPVRQAPVEQARSTNYFQAQAPEYQNNFANRAYSYTAPTYAAQAQGVSFSYQAQF